MSRARKLWKTRKDHLLRVAGIWRANHESQSEDRRDAKNTSRDGHRVMNNGSEPSKKRKKDRGEPKEGVKIDGANPKSSQGKDGEARPVVDVVAEDHKEPENLEELVRGRIQDILSRPGVAQVTVNLVESGVERKILLKRPPQSEIEGSVVERTDEEEGHHKVS